MSHPLIAIGAFSMAFIELWKKLLDKCTKFQARRGVEWLRGADHSDYWGDGASGPSLQSTTEAGMFLRLGELRREVSVTRALSTIAALSTPRSLIDQRSLPIPRTDCR